MTFNAKEIAEKIVTKFNGDGARLSNTDETYLRELVEIALLGAYQEGSFNSDDKWRARKDACVDILRKGIAFWEKKALEAHAAGVNEGLERAAKVADGWAVSKSCDYHEDNPCCHIRLGAEIESRIRALKKEPK